MEIQEVKKIQFVKIGKRIDWLYYDIDNHDFKFLISLDEGYLLQAYDDEFLVLGNQSYAYIFSWKRERPYMVFKSALPLKTLLAPTYGIPLLAATLPEGYKCKFLLLYGERLYQCQSYAVAGEKVKAKLCNGKRLFGECCWDTDMDTGQRIESLLSVSEDDEI